MMLPISRVVGLFVNLKKTEKKMLLSDTKKDMATPSIVCVPSPPPTPVRSPDAAAFGALNNKGGLTFYLTF